MISELDPRDAVERELLLVTVDAVAGSRTQIIELVQVFEGRILNVGHERLTLSLEGHPDKLDDFEELLRPHGIVELQRTGRVALPKIFEGKIVAVAPDAVTLSLEGHPDKLDDFEELLAGYGIVELQRSGRVALPKLDRSAQLRAVPSSNTKGKVG